MAYGRAITVTAGGVTLISVSSIAEDTQNCHFEISQRTTQSPNTAVFRVYNPATSTALSVPDGVKTQGKLTITAGYEDEGTVLLFTGDIKQRRIGKENAVTTYVEVIAADGDQAYNVAKVSAKLDKGKTPQDAVDLAVQAMAPYGITMGYVSPGLLSMPTYNRGQVFFSLAREILRNVAKSGDAEWSVQNGELEVVKKTDAKPGSVDVNAGTGMIGMPRITPEGIVVRTLLNGNVKVNSSIRLNQKDIQSGSVNPNVVGGDVSKQTFVLDTVAASADGTYKVFAVQRVGTLRGDEWYNEITCVGSSGFAQGQLNYPDFTRGNAAATQPGGAGSGAQSQAASGAGGAQGGLPTTPNFGSGNG